MDRSRNFKIEKPKHIEGLETVDPAIFDELSKSYPDIPNKCLEWDKKQKRHNKKVPMFNILADITQRVHDYVGETTGVEPRLIEHSVRTAPIYPRKSQIFRARLWHADYKAEEERPIVFMAADALPTEFLVPGPRASEAQMEKFMNSARLAESYFMDQNINVGLEHGLLDTFRPDRYEGVVTQGNVHRSPTNYTGNLVHRTFFLLWVKSDQWQK
jgi:hypothetical protein